MTHRHPLNRQVAFVVAVFHVGAFAALFFGNWNHVILGFTVWAVVSSLGIGVGFHRLLTHRGFKTYRWVEYTLATIGSLARQGLPSIWVMIHRMHHKWTEVEGWDPHTPRDGRWWSHMDWMIHPDPTFQSRAILQKWVPDLIRQPFYRKRYVEWLPTSVLATACLIFGGIPAVLWGVALPVTVGWHQTWAVNSATHLWGYRRFDTKDDSRNLWWVAILSWGEGWHNSHHHDQVSARHGLAWYEVDINYYLIKAMQVMGLAWDVHEAKL